MENSYRYIIPKLSSASFALKVVKPFLSLDSLKMVYYSYFHFVMTYGLIFWGNSHHSNIIFGLQKRSFRIIVGIRGRDSCREHFKTLKILPLQSQYIYIHFCFLWLIMGIILGWTLRYTTSILGINWIYICQYLICQYIRREHITLGLGCSKVSLLKWKNCAKIEINLKLPWKISCIFIHFIPWMNILVVIIFKTFTII